MHSTPSGASPARPSQPSMEPFDLEVCVHYGYPGCLGWPEYHDQLCEYGTATYHACSECGADDVYGAPEHAPTCSLYEPADVR